MKKIVISSNSDITRKRHNEKKTPTKLLSPLALLTLAACKGGNGSDTANNFEYSGTAVKGLLSDAFVFADLDGDGQHSVDEPSTQTDENGRFTLITSDRSANVIVTSTASTTDASTGAVASGIKLVGTTDGAVVSAATTLLSQSDISPEDVASALGLDGVDIANYNPFNADADPATALKFEQISHQIQNILTATKVATEGSGLDEVAAFNTALQSVVEVTKTAIEEAAAATEAGEVARELDFSEATTIASIKGKVVEKLTTNSEVDTDALEAKLMVALEAAKNVNIEVAATNSLDGAKGAFSLGQLLSDQLEAANDSTDAQVSLAVEGNAAIEAANLAPTNIVLSTTSVAENSQSLVVGTITAEDDGGSGNVSFELVDTEDASAFVLSSDGYLSLKSAANFETQDSYALKVRATDASGKASIGNISVTVENVNDAPTGAVTISGTTSQGEELTAVTTTLADEDGLGDLNYQWLRDGSEISGATASTYTLQQDDVDTAISVSVSYTDGGGAVEEVTSAPTSTIANTNDLPTGGLSITGTASQENTLTVDATALRDEDGLGDLSYQWLRDGSDISGATATAYTLVEADVGKNISVKATYTDGYGAPETVTSSETSAVTNRNDSPTGAITISGTAAEDQTLTAASTLEDPDGMSELSYQWKADGVEISNATNSTLTLSQNEVGKEISVTANYTDGGGTVETVTSASTSTVINVNDLPAGGVTISGTAAEDQTLTAVTTALADEDGLGQLSYQWLRDGSEVTGATAATYTLTQVDVDTAISVSVSYSDNYGQNESVTSTATSTVSNVNDDPTGNVTISGTAVEDQTLTAVTTTLADEDGLGELSYQWKADGADITGATNSTIVLSQDEVGKTIGVEVSYTDGSGTTETVTSPVTSETSNVNDAHSGDVTISGTMSQGEELTAVTTTLADEDGLGDLNYQWLRDGSEISGATASTYTLTQDDVDTAISVRVSYTDDGGAVEEVITPPTESITPPPAFDIIVTSAESDVVTFAIYTNSLVDPENDGFGSLDMVLNHDPTDMLIDIETFTGANPLTGLPNYTSSDGELIYGAFALGDYFTDLSLPIATFNATILDADNPIDITLSGLRIESDSYNNVVETFDLSPGGDILSSGSAIIA